MKTISAAIILLFFSAFYSCSGEGEKSNDSSPYQYVKPSIDYRGRFRKGHMRKSVSTDKNAYRNRARSRYYYHTKGKYMRKSRRSSK